MWNRRRSGLFRRDNYKVDYLGSYQLPGSATTFTFPWVLLGKPDPTREVILVAASRNGTIAPRVVDAATLLGTTPGIDQGDIQVAGLSICSIRFQAPQKASSGAVTVTWSGSVADFCAIGVFRIANRPAYGLIYSDFDTGGTTTGTSVTLNATTVKPKGFLIGGCVHGNTNAQSVTNCDMKEQITTSSGQTVSFVMRPPADMSNTPSIVWSWSGSAGQAAISHAFDYAP